MTEWTMLPSTHAESELNRLYIIENVYQVLCESLILKIEN